MGRTSQIICGVVLALGLGGAQERPGHDVNASARTQQQQNAPVAAPPPAPRPAYRPYPLRNSDACYGVQDHDAADLCAQWRSAIAAEKAAREARIATIAAIIGTVFSLVTVIGLIVTIVQTHGALGEARRGNRLNLTFERRSRRDGRKASEDQERALDIAARNADAAAGHVEIAHDTAERQLRAYVIATAGQITAFNVGEQATCGVLLENKGQTPAYQVIQTRFGLEYLDVTDNPPIGRGSTPRVAPVVIGPDCHITATTHTKNRLTVEQRSAVFAHKAILHAFGTVEYVDAFKKRRTTRFSFMFGGAIGADSQGSMGMAPDDNESD